ncbi:succinate dehydrogenase [Anaerosinus massiliensis]|uniref:succinate dehydrogenase n=1 Tax=Massilibacillus massiliensis TaxID=1806837 RepID=UPI000AD9F9B6|nr:succinate dehydrogenase [Massilibacillus massiliensis]
MSHTTFYVRRLHSLCGIVPVGFFLIEHIFTISSVLGGASSFDAAVARLALIPHDIMIFMEIFFIAIPFLFHGIYGAIIAMQAKNNPQQYGYVRNWQFYFQRITAWYTIVFLLWHVGYLRIMMKGSGVEINYALMNNYLSNPIVFVLYTVGMVAAVYHFTNGLFTFTMTWGIAKGPRAQAMFNKAALALCVLLSVIGVVSLTRFIA